jgi:Flp pilus assembly protein TadD
VNRYYLPVIPLLGIVTTFTLQAQPVFALERSEIAARVKELTVQIEGQETTGTGTIIERNGNSYTILTCWHVVNAKGNFKVTTPDGETHQVTGVKNLKNIDLAILQFTSNTTYQVAELGDSQTITEGMNNYVVGYPDPIPGIPERAYMFLDANIVSKLSQGEKGYQIVHNNPTTGGSSGGGIFDNNGLLVGVNGRTTSDAEGRVSYGLAIPLQIYVAAKSNFITPTNITPPQDFVSVGRRKLKQKDYQGAITKFNQALASNPNDIDAYYGRGQAYFSQQDYQAAVNDLNQIIRFNPQLVDAYIYRGASYDDLGEYEKAIADYNEAIRLDPEDAEVYTNRGASYNVLGKYNEAIQDLNKAIRLNPDSAEAYGNRGISYNAIGDKVKAIEDFRQAANLFQQQGDTENYQKTLSLIEELK